MRRDGSSEMEEIWLRKEERSAASGRKVDSGNGLGEARCTSLAIDKDKSPRGVHRIHTW